MISFESILSEQFGSIMISIILGLGFASLFKRVCKKDCIIYKVENYSKIKNKIYEWNDKCYQYEKVNTECKKEKKKKNNYIREEITPSI